jgi:ParB family chromosome partitioning protein
MLLKYYLKGSGEMSLAAKKAEDSKNSGEIFYLPCNKLVDHPLHFDFYIQSHLEGLVSSIREAGLLEPIVVCVISGGDEYRILSGHYRIRAVRRLKLKQILCRVVKCDERLAAIIYCTSNLLTRGLSAIEESYTISLLVSSKEKFTMTDIGKLWGRSKSWVSRRLALITHLEPKLRKEIGNGYLNPRIAQELARLPQGNDQERVLKIIRKEFMNKDDAAKLVSFWTTAKEEERETIEQKGFLKKLDNLDKNDSDLLNKSITQHFLDLTNVLTDILAITNSQNVTGWWPMEKYNCFKVVSKNLDNILKEQLVNLRGGLK